MNITITELDELKSHLEGALKDSLQQQINPLIAKLETVAPRITALEVRQAAITGDVGSLKRNQAKALIGYTVLVAGVTTLLAHAKLFLWQVVFGNNH